MNPSPPQKPDAQHVSDIRISLEKYFEVRIQELQRHYDYRLDKLDRERQAQVLDFDRRLSAVDDAQRTKFPTREDMASITNRFDKDMSELRNRYGSDIETLKLSRAMLEGKASQLSVNIALMLSLIGIAIALLGAAWKYMVLS